MKTHIWTYEILTSPWAWWYVGLYFFTGPKLGRNRGVWLGGMIRGASTYVPFKTLNTPTKYISIHTHMMICDYVIYLCCIDGRWQSDNPPSVLFLQILQALTLFWILLLRSSWFIKENASDHRFASDMRFSVGCCHSWHIFLKKITQMDINFGNDSLCDLKHHTTNCIVYCAMLCSQLISVGLFYRDWNMEQLNLTAGNTAREHIGKIAVVHSLYATGCKMSQSCILNI